MLRLDPDEKIKQDEQDSIVLSSNLTSPKTLIKLPTKTYVDSLHGSSRNRRDLSSVFNDQDNQFDNNKPANLDSVSVHRNSTSSDEPSNKKYVDDSIGEGTIVRFIQSLQNFLKVTVGVDVYNLTKYDRIQNTDITIIKYPNRGGYLLQDLKLECNDKNNIGKIQNLIKSTETDGPTGDSRTTDLAPISDSFL